MFRMGFLEVSTSDFRARNLRRDGQYRDSAALTVVEAVDQVHVSRPAASGAYGQFAGEMCLCTGGECAGFFIAHADPFDVVASANRIGDAIQRIAWNTVNSFNTRSDQD